MRKPQPADVRAGLLDHVRPADRLDRHLAAGVPHADAQPIALDQLAALVGHMVRDLGRVQCAVNEAGERLDLGERPFGPGRRPGGDELVVLAGVPGHLEGVVQEGRVEPRVVGRVLEHLQNADRLLVRR